MDLSMEFGEGRMGIQVTVNFECTPFPLLWFLRPGIGCELHLGLISGMAGLIRVGVGWGLSMQLCQGRMGIYTGDSEFCVHFCIPLGSLGGGIGWESHLGSMSAMVGFVRVRVQGRSGVDLRRAIAGRDARAWINLILLLYGLQVPGIRCRATSAPTQFNSSQTEIAPEGTPAMNLMTGAVNALFSFKPFFKFASGQARKMIIERGTDIGFPWAPELARLQIHDWDSELKAAQNPDIEYPEVGISTNFFCFPSLPFILPISVISTVSIVFWVISRIALCVGSQHGLNR